jgi:hypothetical protein
MECLIILGNGIVDAVIGLCVENIYKKIKNKFYSNNHSSDESKKRHMESIHIKLKPQSTDEEIILLTRKNSEPQIFKKNKKVNFVNTDTDTNTDTDIDKI